MLRISNYIVFIINFNFNRILNWNFNKVNGLEYISRGKVG